MIYSMNKLATWVSVFLSCAVALLAQSPEKGVTFENRFLKMTILPNWNIRESEDRDLILTRGKFQLTIIPLLLHTSGADGVRFGEYALSVRSILAVMRNVEEPAGGDECAQWPSEALTVTEDISLRALYTDDSKVNAGCNFPSSRGPVWFGSVFGGSGPECDYAITLGYDSDDVNALPKKGSPELNRVFGQASEMLKTLQLKPPIVVTGVDPPSAPPGATVTIHGSGFNLSAGDIEIVLSQPPDPTLDRPAWFGVDVLDPVVAPDGKALKFDVPISIDRATKDVPGCPTQFCGVPTPPGTYELSIGIPPISDHSASFTVVAPESGPVSLSIVSPDVGVEAGQTIFLRGKGFTPTGNVVIVGSAPLSNVPSPDEETLEFRAPQPVGPSLSRSSRVYRICVINGRGQNSNFINLSYK